MTENKDQVVKPQNFIRNIILEDLKNNKNGGRIATRFPPEPNGYLHIGHAKAICISFGFAKEFNGTCNLRFDDTNPAKEDVEYIDSIKADVKWLGFDWGDKIYYASDYFDKLYQCAVELIQQGKAYVCELSAEELREYRGTLTEPGRDSPYRNRSVEENLNLFERMKNGEFEDGKCLLRAKIDMSSPNVNMRDPAIYRIRKVTHPKTGDKWCIYPMYDFTHCISDALEGITHSICTLEFEDHRPLYDWYLDQLNVSTIHPQQIEFSRLNIDYMVMSKRKLLKLVQEHHVSGWDDPRMPTLVGFRRRGYTPSAIRDFAERVGVTKSDSCIEMSFLEHCLREDLDKTTPRVMGVLKPLKVVITNYPDGKVEQIDAPYHPMDPSLGSRTLPFSKELYIDQEDFMEVPASKYFRLAPNKEVRLRYGYIIKCDEVIKNPQTGEVVELRCSYDPDTLGKNPSDGRKVKGIIHWISKDHAFETEVRLYDRLFTVPNPSSSAEGKDFLDYFNPKSFEVVHNAKLEPSLKSAAAESRFQFERVGYFCADLKDSRPKKPVFNRIVTLKDSWAKISSSGSAT